MKIQLQGHERKTATSIGMLTANLIVAVLVFQFGVPLHPNVVATGTLFVAALTNMLVSKYLS
jgi:hypothetical protein